MINIAVVVVESVVYYTGLLSSREAQRRGRSNPDFKPVRGSLVARVLRALIKAVRSRLAAIDIAKEYVQQFQDRTDAGPIACSSNTF